MSLHKKIDASKRFLELVLSDTNRLQLANSGGKDSLVIYTLAKEVGHNIPIIHTNTTIDPDGTLPFIRSEMPETIIMHPEESFYQLVTRKMLPVRKNRYCCEYLKEYAGIGMRTIEGVRASESSSRSGREIISCDTRKTMEKDGFRAQHIYPIYEWSDDDVWGFIRMRGLEVAPCYHLGLKRLGCVGCPQVTKKGIREKEFQLYPRRYDACKKAIDKGMQLHPTWKITRYTDGDAEKAMKWWLSSKPMYEYFGYDLPFIRKSKFNPAPEQKERKR